jgi:hypothetical protein
VRNSKLSKKEIELKNKKENKSSTTFEHRKCVKFKTTGKKRENHWILECHFSCPSPKPVPLKDRARLSGGRQRLSVRRGEEIAY